MPFFSENKYSEGTKVYVWTLTETAEDLRMLCRRRGIDISGMNDIHANSRKCEKYAEHLLLQLIFGKTVELDHAPNGAPYIREEGINISISHTFGSVCIATNPLHPIGIDVERKGTRVLRVRDKFLNDLELRWIAENDANANLMAWTAKEALYKLVSIEGTSLKDHLQLEPFTPVEIGKTIYQGRYTNSLPYKEFTIISDSTIDNTLTLATVKEPLFNPYK